MKFSRRDIPASHVISLAWLGDELVDWVNGGARYFLDGRSEPSRIHWAYRFDAAVATHDNEFAVIYARTGTKALLLRNGKLLRELNRSFYCAHVYEYPICIWKTQEGRALIAHCPEDYRRIDIEDAETGDILTKGARSSQDFFHSRLMVNSDGTRLLSAGWVWHPLDMVTFFDINDALTNPASLDKYSNQAFTKAAQFAA